MTRNQSVLKFQRRLIRTARSSPRLESMKLLGIVYSNLMEFFHVRVPLDENPNEIMEDWVETFDLFCRTIRASFINLFVINDPTVAVYSATEKLIHAILDKRDFEATTEELVTCYEAFFNDCSPVYHCIMEKDHQIGLFIKNGMFLHRITIWHSLMKYWEDEIAPKLTDEIKVSDHLRGCIRYMQSHYQEQLNLSFCTSRNGITMPAPGAIYNELRSAEAFGRYAARWIKEKKECAYPFAELNIRLNPAPKKLEIESDGLDGDIMGARVFYPDASKMSNAPYHYGVAVDNPIFFEFNQVADFIIDREKGSVPSELVYDETGLSEYHGVYFVDRPCFGKAQNESIEDLDKSVISSCMTVSPIFVRTPVAGYEAIIPRIILLSIFQDPSLANQVLGCETAEEIRELVRNVSESRPDIAELITNAYMTVYRTGKIKGMVEADSACIKIDDANTKLILFLAYLYGKKIHIFLECRAREDELNNLWLLRLLQHKADVQTMLKNNPRWKVHAKVWAFEKSSGNKVTVISTGNFSDSAQIGFSDSYLIIPGNPLAQRTGRRFVDECIFSLEKGTPIGDEVFDDVVTEFGRIGLANIPIKLPETFPRERTKYLIMSDGVTTPRIALTRAIRRCIINVRDMKVDPRDCHIRIKCNHITDDAMVHFLMSAAEYGIRVDIMARTTSTIPSMGRPNTMTVRSIMGKYLEHDRAFIIEDGSSTEVYLGSLDLMPRNLDHRIESLFWVPDEWEGIKKTIIDIFDDMFYAKTNPAIGFFNYKI